MDIEHLAVRLGAKPVRLLEMPSEHSVTATSFSDLVLSRYGSEYLLVNKNARAEVMHANNTYDASRLGSLLGFESPSDPFMVISAVDYGRLC
jgi:hypothetical protein